MHRASPARRAGVALVALAFTLASTAALARPMKVAVYEAHARAEPRDDAPIVEVFIEETKVSVSEEEFDGWVQVRLSDGGSGWLRVASLTPYREAKTLLRRPATPPPAPVQAPVARSEIFVKDFDHLAELVRHDSVVHPLAKDLRDRHAASQAWLWGGVGVGSLLMLLGVINMTSDTSDYVDSGAYDDPPDHSGAYVLIGLGGVVALAGLVASGSQKPSRNDILDVLNTWNRRHPDEPFTMEQR